MSRAAARPEMQPVSATCFVRWLKLSIYADPCSVHLYSNYNGLYCVEIDTYKH